MNIKKRGRPKNPFSETSVGTIQTLERALAVLSALAAAERVSLSDLSLSVGLPTATTYRILNTLKKYDFVSFDPERQHWMIGVEAFRIGASFLKRRDLAEISRPVMRALMEKTGETANLAVSRTGMVIFIGHVETNNPIRAFFPPSTQTPMHASGVGKAILAALDPEQVRKMLTQTGLERFTETTHTVPKTLFDDLKEIRERGWSFDQEERHRGMSCIGSAIFDEDGVPCAGVSISGPSSRFAPPRRAVLGALVAEAAAAITQKTGGRHSNTF